MIKRHGMDLRRELGSSEAIAARIAIIIFRYRLAESLPGYRSTS